MRHVSIRLAVAAGVTVLASAAAAAAIAFPAGAATGTAASTFHPAPAVYVAVGGSAGAADRGCGSAGYSSIQAAVSAVRPGGTVVVCGGTYDEQVTVAKPVSLAGRGHAVIDAAGQINGVLIKAAHVTVSGFTITGATGEGILVESVDYATIEHNVVTGNDQGGLPVDPVPTSYAECQAQDGVPGDCGEGIHLMGSSYSVITANTSTANTGGILLSDETGPTAHNRITGNVVADNLSDCGITIAGHNPAAAPGGVPAPGTAGVYANVIARNTIAGNGTTGQGAGVVLATGLAGGAVYDNTVTANIIAGNGISGVTVHSHLAGQDLNGNTITGNLITVNNLDGDNDFAPHVDDQTTGILVATIAPLTITITGNQIAGNHFGIWTTGPVTTTGATANYFAGDTIPVAQG